MIFNKLNLVQKKLRNIQNNFSEITLNSLGNLVIVYINQILQK